MSESERHTLVIPFVGGLDTKSDRMTVQQGKLLELENGVFTKHNLVAKRFGYDSVPFTTVDGEACLGLPKGLHSVRDELILTTTEKLYSYSEKNNAWAERGDFSPIVAEQTEVLGSNVEQGIAEVATANGVTVYVWAEGDAIYATCTDENTGSVYFNRFALQASNGVRPRVVAVGGTLQVFWVNTSTDDIYTWTVRSWEPQVATDTAGVAVITDFETTYNRYDVVEATDDYCLLVWANTTPDVRIAQIGPGGAALLAKDVATSVTILTTSDLSVTYYGGKAFVFWLQSTAQYRRYRVNTSDLVTDISDPATIVAGADNISSAANSTGVLVVFEDTGASNDLSITKTTTLNHTFSGTPYWAGGLARHSYIAAAPFVLDDVIYTIVGHDSRSGLQDGYYIYNQNGVLCGQLMFGEGAGVIDTSAYIPKVRQTATGVQLILHYKRFADAADDDIDVREHIGMRRVTLSHQKVESREAEGVLYLGGSQVWSYDGINVTEAAVSMFPDIISDDITDEIDGSGTITSGTYTFRIYFEGRNAKGQRVRSGAITKAHTFAAAGSDDSIQIVVPTLSFTEWADLAVVGYVTEKNKTDFFYRFTSNDPASWTSNNISADSVTLTYTDEAVIAGAEIDPFVFEEPSETVPAGPYISMAGNRLLMGGGAVGADEVVYSKLQFPGENLRFSQTFKTEAAPRDGGSVRGIGNLDNTPIVFKERGIYGIDGDGPDNNNLGGGFLPELITTDVGLRDSGTIATLPTGLMFVSQKGIYLIDRSLQAQYIGARAERFNALNFVSANIIPNTNLVVFLASDGVAVVYDYFYDEWGTWTNHAGLDSTIRKGTQYCYLRPDGQVYLQNTGYSDAGATYKLRARTAPIHFGSIQGFYKMLRFQIVGNYKSEHELRVSLYYNRETAPYETYTWDPSTVITTSYWGDQATWGADSVWGGSLNGSDYHHEHRPKRRKCQSISFELEELPGSPPGAGFEIIEIAIDTVTWPGLGRIPTSRKH